MSVETKVKAVTIAVVDDHPGVCKTVLKYLRKIGCEVTTYTDAEACLSALKTASVDIVITDLKMPGIDGMTVLERVRKEALASDVIVITGHADKGVAIQALKLGAHDFFEKPVDEGELVETVKRTVRYQQAVRDRDRYAKQLLQLSEREAKRWGVNAFVGRSTAIQKIVKKVQKVQHVDKVSVLITGESGTGKELVARMIHFGGSRSSGPFVPLNCAAVPHDLAESILFGHMKGSFTGATADKKGAFDAAAGGTLFLDEIGDMPAAMQTKLLRVLDDGMVMPIGAGKSHQVDVRVIAATNANLGEKYVVHGCSCLRPVCCM